MKIISVYIVYLILLFVYSMSSFTGFLVKKTIQDYPIRS